MIRLNLLRFLDKSFSEIYQITHGEIQLVEEEEELESSFQEEQVIEKKPKKLVLTLSILLGLILVISLAVGGYFYYKLKLLEKEIALKKKQIVAQTQQAIKPKPMDNKPKVDDDYNELAEFKPIGEIVFLEEKEVERKPSEKSKGISIIPAKDNGTVAQLIKEKDNTTKIGEVKQYKYNLVIEDCYSGDIDRIKNILKEFNLSYVSKEKERVKIVVYKAYRYTDRSDIYIGNKPVVFLGYFYSKDEAVSFLRENSLKGVITSKMEEVVKYEVTVTSFNSESDIASFLVRSKLKNKKIRIDKS